MGAKRRRNKVGVKAKVALAAMRGDRTTSRLVSQFGVHSTQIGQWKPRLLDVRRSCSPTTAAARSKHQMHWSRSCTNRSVGFKWSWLVEKKSCRLD